MLQRMVEIVPPLHIEDGYLSPCFLVQIGSHSQIEGFLTKQKAITLLAIVQTGDWLSSNRPESRIPVHPGGGMLQGVLRFQYVGVCNSTQDFRSATVSPLSRAAARRR